MRERRQPAQGHPHVPVAVLGHPRGEVAGPGAPRHTEVLDVVAPTPGGGVDAPPAQRLQVQRAEQEGLVLGEPADTNLALAGQLAQRLHDDRPARVRLRPGPGPGPRR
ncbi:MAG: hypothetical protein DCC50_10145 [Acidobacteria bacterium]|nr:MAG: hypothetical protein DCC50_10145 [Acidobacteriota bacterium]